MNEDEITETKSTASLARGFLALAISLVGFIALITLGMLLVSGVFFASSSKSL